MADSILKLACPRCEELREVKFPAGFYFNNAALECGSCDLKFRGTGFDNDEAVDALKENIKLYRDFRKTVEANRTAV